jgi:RNA polymerase sigma factor FliA
VSGAPLPVAVATEPTETVGAGAAKPRGLQGDLNEVLGLVAPSVRRWAARLARRLPGGVGATAVVSDDLFAAGMAAAFDIYRRPDVDAEREEFPYYLRLRVRGAMMDHLRRRDVVPRRSRSGRAAGWGPAGGDPASTPTSVVSLEEIAVGKDSLAMSLAQESPLEQAEAAANRARLLRAVAGLPDRERLIITMHYLEGVRFKEIGSLLGVSEPRISQLHSRAMDSLREQLRGEPEPRSGVRIRARAHVGAELPAGPSNR